VVRECDGSPYAIVIATGSEVQLAVRAAEALALENIHVRIVSMPCVEAFERESQEWRDAVIPPDVPVVTVEAGVTRGWWKYAGRRGAVIGLDHFGESAPDTDLWAHFDFTPARVAGAVRQAASRATRR
jgi:transketolase